MVLHPENSVKVGNAANSHNRTINIGSKPTHCVNKEVKLINLSVTNSQTHRLIKIGDTASSSNKRVSIEP